MVRLWERMAVLYGRAWTDQCGPTPLQPDGRSLTVFGTEWAGVIRGVAPDDVMIACDRARDSGSRFAPLAPEFRLLCFDVPHRNECEAYLRGQREPTPFTREVARTVDLWNWKGSPTWAADKILQGAYDAVRKRVLGGEVLKPLDPVLEHQPQPRTPARPETVSAEQAACFALLGIRPQSETAR